MKANSTRGPIHQHFSRISLAGRMVFLVVAIMVASLLLMAGITATLLHRQLIRQVDTQLMASAGQLANTVSAMDVGTQESIIPSNYYIRRLTDNQPPLVFITSGTEADSGTPDIGDLLTDPQVTVSPSGITDPVTVTSTKPGSRWRAVAVPMFYQSTSESAGSVTVALPLDSANETLRATAVSFLLVGLVLSTVGGIAGYFLVRRSLRPLKQIEWVAGRIASGELSERVPDYPVGTEVGSLALSLNTMLTQIENSFHARDVSERKMRRFVSDASHELRTPLAAIRGYGELYRLGGVPDERVGEVMGRIESESSRMGTLVTSLLTLARLDEERPLNITTVDLRDLADEVRSDLQALDPKRPVQVTGLNGDPDLQELKIAADHDQLTQVLLNLLGNIHRYTPSDCPVEILVGTLQQSAYIVIRDHGPGVGEGEQQRIFERFYRTDQSRARTSGGSGLGLSIVAAIIEAHQGAVTASETPGGGLTVTITLPIEQPHLTSSGAE